LLPPVLVTVAVTSTVAGPALAGGVLSRLAATGKYNRGRYETLPTPV